jgi:hypothetical protein
MLTWTLALAPTTSTRLLNQIGSLLPDRYWTNERVLWLMAVIARVALGAGSVRLAGETPSGNRFLANPHVVWIVTASRATVAGRDLGPLGPITPQPALGDYRIPRRGLFAFGSALMLAPR